MPPRKSATLTEAELRLMKLLWERGDSAVSDLVAAMPEGEALAYTSVLTTVRILEQKGYVRHRQEGVAGLASPSVLPWVRILEQRGDGRRGQGGRAFLSRRCVEERGGSRSEIRH